MIFSLQEEFEFRLPQKTLIYGGDITETKCLGRWPAEFHVASEGFTDDYFRPANFVLFNENKFAVIYLEGNSTDIYTRLDNGEFLNSSGDGGVTTNTETSAGDDGGVTGRAENDQQVVISVFSHL